MAGSHDPPRSDLECAVDALEAARDHLLLAARGLMEHTWSNRELRGRRLPAAQMEIERIAMEVSLIVDLIEFDFQD
jgi:hypothetical protein